MDSSTSTYCGHMFFGTQCIYAYPLAYKVNERITGKYFLSLTYKVLTTSKPIAVLTISSSTLSRVPAPHLLSPFLAHSDMHHPVSGINSLIYSVSLASHVSTHLLIHLSAYVV